MKKIFKKLSYVFFGNIANAISKFLIIIFITKILSEYELGVYTFSLALTAPITLLFNMKMRSFIISSDFIDYNVFLKLRNISNIVAILCILIISVLFYSEMLIVIMLVGLIKILEINSEFYQAFPNKEKIFEKPSIIMIIKVFLSTIIFFVTLIVTKSLTFSLLLQVLFLIAFLLIEKNINLSLVSLSKYNYKLRLRSLVITLIPLGIVQALLSFSSNIPKYYLEYEGLIKELGIFSGILYLVTIINLFMTTITQTLLPYMKELYMKNRRRFNIIINLYSNIGAIIIGALFIIMSYFIGDIILETLFSNEFTEYTYLLSLFSFIITLNISGWMYDSSLLLAGALKFQPYFLVIISLLTLGIGSILIEEYSLWGAGITLLIFNLFNTLSKALYYNIHIRRGDKNY